MLVEELNQAISARLQPLCASLAAASGPDPLVPAALRADEMRAKITEELLLFRQKCRQGLIACFDSMSSRFVESKAIKAELKAAFQKMNTLDAAELLGNEEAKGTPFYKLLDIQESSVETFFMAAKWLFDDKLYGQALKAFTFVALLNHRHFQAWIGIAHSSVQLGDYATACDGYKRAMLCDPASFWPHLFISKCYIDKKEYSEALDSLEKAQSLFRDSERKDPAIEQQLLKRIVFVRGKK